MERAGSMANFARLNQGIRAKEEEGDEEEANKDIGGYSLGDEIFEVKEEWPLVIIETHECDVLDDRKTKVEGPGEESVF